MLLQRAGVFRDCIGILNLLHSHDGGIREQLAVLQIVELPTGAIMSILVPNSSNIINDTKITNITAGTSRPAIETAHLPKGASILVPNIVNATNSTNTTNGTKRLKLDWTHLPPQSELAKRLQALQSSCSLPFKNYEPRKGCSGLGSDLHVWSKQL